MTLLGAILLLFTILLYLASVVNLATMNQSDPAGNSLSQAYAVLMAIGLWILLAALALLAGIKGALPIRALFAALVLVAISGAAAVAAIQLLSDNLYRSRWPLLIPVLAPLLILGFALWAYFPSVRQSMPVARVGSLGGTALLVLSILPWPALRYRSGHRETDQTVQESERLEQERQQNVAAFQRLTQDSELSEWLAFRQPDNPLRTQALEGIRRLPRRQADAEEMMRRGRDWFWQDVPLLDLQATPVICDRARHFLTERAADLQPPHPETPPRFAMMAERIEPYLPTLQWLVDQRCECDTELAAIETAVRIYPDSPDRNQVLAELARIRKPR